MLSTQKNSIGANFTNISIYDSSNLKFESKNLLTSKYTLVDFWFSHCAPCIAEFPHFKELCSNYATEDFKIIGISIDKKTDRNLWIKTIKINSLNWPQYWDIDGKNASFLGITGFPQNFLLDKNGIILGKNLATSQIESFLSKKLF